MKYVSLRKRISAVATPVLALTFAALAVFGVWQVIQATQKTAKIAGSVTLGYCEGEYALALHVADSLDLFAGYGVEVTLHPFGKGLDSYQALLRGEVDLAGPTEYIIAGGALRRENVRIVCSIVKTDIYSIVARKDHGIDKISDLAGRRIGLMRNTIEDFILGRFLELHGLQITDVSPVHVDFSKTFETLRNGIVDAVVARPPDYDSIKRFFGDGMIEWPAQNNQWIFGLLVSTGEWIAQNSDPLARLLKALDEANNYIARNQGHAQRIILKQPDKDAESIDRIWRRNIFFLSLDQSLIAAMEDEARWMIKNNLTTETQTPDFLGYIYTDALKKVKPEAVHLIR